MAFQILMQNNASETNHVTKSLTTVATLEGVLRGDSTIIDPVILIEADLEDIVTCNYCTIEAFGRAYFINNMRLVRTRLVEISCHVDVISSFADEIKANQAIVRKSEDATAYNLYINDGSLVSYQDPYILTEPFPGGFDGHTLILAIAGGTAPSL